MQSCHMDKNAKKLFEIVVTKIVFFQIGTDSVKDKLDTQIMFGWLSDGNSINIS